jgi:hypothetical protein
MQRIGGMSRMRWVYLAVTVLTFAACGVQWFPEDKTGGATTGTDAAPTFFNFTSPRTVRAGSIPNLPKNTLTGNPYVTSNSVAIKGTNTNGWPVVFRTYSGIEARLYITDTDGVEFQYDPGATDITTLPTDTMKIQMTPDLVAGRYAISSVTVGNYTANFIVQTTLQ